ncbi:MAG: RNA methyltransferase [Lachnospiraceae bacterium]|nr:RNA methyltransferase [Lachnospiraceae bacterium]
MISSTANGKVKQVVAWQTKARERKKDGVFIVEGLRMFEEAPLDWISQVYVSSKCLAGLESGNGDRDKAILERLEMIAYEEVTDEVFSKMSDTQTPQGILSVLRRPTYSLSDILGQNALIMILEDLQDPGNLGTILRTGEGAGINGVIMSKDTVDIFNPKVIRATMGSIYRMPFVYVEDLKDILDTLHIEGIQTYAAHLQGENYYDSFDFRNGTAFLIGNEGNGLKKETADQAKSYLKIPMEGKVESLNAAIAASLLMYEAHRQRKTK